MHIGGMRWHWCIQYMRPPHRHPSVQVNQFQVSPAGLGTIYATISFFDMLTAQPVAAFADKIGHKVWGWRRHGARLRPTCLPVSAC